MPALPALPEVQTYLATTGTTHPDTVVAPVLAAEIAAQARRCRFPADPAEPAAPLPYPADLKEALFRRVAHTLAVRALPLGVQANLSEFGATTTRVGGTDAEVRRLEAPHRKLVKG
ncbi:hypothetical protein [Nocardioides sp.]|uniref:hypothetical protein n=1 Tax=Nocardioides sp. TaxID=35761 RepID=UPI002BF39BBD|nr:hypothetical protein [Nocardioides sp.]HSX66669.1 hypothetical protein [Nocardioides sp.]